MKIIIPLLGVCSAISASGAVSLSIGLNDNGGFRIINNSTAGESVFSVTLSFNDGDTFFDTDDASPGNLSQPFSSTNNSGSTTVILPNSMTTDGESSAVFAFIGDSPGSDISVFFDLDLLSFPDVSGNAAAAVFSIGVIEGGNAATYIYGAAGPGTVGGDSFSQTFTVVPEPASLLLGAIGGTLLVLRRKRP